MRGKWKRSIVIVFAIALVISAGVYSSDHFLKATDGEENNLAAPESADEPTAVAEEAELPTEEVNVMTIEQGYFESDIIAEASTEEGISDEKSIEGNPVEGEVQSSEIQPTEEKPEELLASTAELKDETAASVENGKTTKQETDALLTQKLSGETEKSVQIAYEVIGGEYTGIGSQIMLTAVLTGYDGLNPSYQWQYSDGGDWIDIDGETSSVYLLSVTKENSTYSWRVSVTD
jgi:hypothetical protein